MIENCCIMRVVYLPRLISYYDVTLSHEEFFVTFYESTNQRRFIEIEDIFFHTLFLAGQYQKDVDLSKCCFFWTSLYYNSSLFFYIELYCETILLNITIFFKTNRENTDIDYCDIINKYMIFHKSYFVLADAKRCIGKLLRRYHHDFAFSLRANVQILYSY